MADHTGEPMSTMEKITEKLHDRDSSSSDLDDEKDNKSHSEPVKAKVYRLFGREKHVHHVMGGGKNTSIILSGFDLAADIFLWIDKKISGGVFGVATAIWVLFELLQYHLLTLVCHLLIIVHAVLFLWLNASKFINRSPPQIPEDRIPQDLLLGVASAFRIEINRGLAILRDIASGRDLKKFLGVIAGLWVFSILGSCCNFLTLLYISFVLLHALPVLYEKYVDQVDAFGQKAEAQIRKLYATFDAKVLSKIPNGPLKHNKLV